MDHARFGDASVIESIKSAIENLHPAYFAMVMATGIVSIASDLLEMSAIGVALCWLNLIFFAILLGADNRTFRLASGSILERLDRPQSGSGVFYDGGGNLHFR